MLGVGIDLASEFHLVAPGGPGEGVIELRRVEHAPEDRRRLVDADSTVVAVNPDLVARRRGPAKKKDDAGNARIACVIAHDDERAARDERRLLNRLRAELTAPFAALEIGGEVLGAPTFRKLLEAWPTAEALGAASRDELVAFARQGHHGWPERFADEVEGALRADGFVARAHLGCAKAATIRLSAVQLLFGAQRRTGERRMGELLLGDPRRGRSAKALPGGEISLSVPGLGERLAARVAAEIGDHIEQFDPPASPQRDAANAPVTRRSGTRALVVCFRLASKRDLRDGLQQWALCSLSRSEWATESSDAKRARGQSHHAVVRALGNRWLEVLWHWVTKGVASEEEIHAANRRRFINAACGGG